MITMFQAGVAAILFLMIAITLLENDIDPTPWRGRQAALAACALAHAVAFAIVTPVKSTRKSGIEETVKQRPAQMSRDSGLFVRQLNSGWNTVVASMLSNLGCE
jgi:hypothetical protein